MRNPRNMGIWYPILQGEEKVIASTLKFGALGLSKPSFVEGSTFSTQHVRLLPAH